MEHRKLTNKLTQEYRVFFALLLVMSLVYFLLSDLMNGSLWSHEVWDSYTLQTWNWLHGRTYIENPENYTYLELAIYEGKYYVSFPPLPSVVLLPFVLLYGQDTPNNLLMAVYGLAAAGLAYAIMLRRGRPPRIAAFWALFLVWGSNMFWMTTIGGVWFQAQALNMVLCLGAVLSAMDGKKATATSLLALAVGCRPLSGVFLPVFALLFAWNEREQHGSFWKSCLAQWKCVLGPVIIGACYMAYNYARFRDPLEFGHNYLPEFVRAEHGQFHWSYLLPNLKQMFFTPVTLEEKRITFPLFQGFSLFVANPLFIVWLARCVSNVRAQGCCPEGIAVAAGVAAVLLLTCLHRTLGGWQFGARYTCDVLPFIYMYLADRGQKHVRTWELTLWGTAVAFNAYGALYMFQHR